MEEEEKKMGSHFFRIIHDYIIEDRRLGIPNKFVKIFGEELGKAGLIEDPTGRIWPVELRKDAGEIYFRNGWQEFMEYFSIGVGHFLIFRYEGDSHFHVSICDLTACEIDYPCQTKDVDESHPDRGSAGDNDQSIENMDGPFQCATRSAHTAANRTGSSCGTNPTSHEQKRRSYVHRQDPNPSHCAANKRRFEDYQEARGSVKCKKSDGFGVNTCKPWSFNFKRHPEVPVTINSDSDSGDKDYQNPGEFAKHNNSGDTEIISCKSWAFNTINSDNESSDGLTMPTQPKSASHGGKHKISKTGEVKVHCPGQDASYARRKVDVSERKFQRATGVFKEARAFKSEFPTCTIIMKPSYVDKRRLVHFPSEYKRFFLTKTGGKFVTLEDSTGKKWHIGYKVSPQNNVCLYKGWYEFVLDNHLKVGDACVFELVHIDNLEMKVSIIRVSPDVV